MKKSVLNGLLVASVFFGICGCGNSSTGTTTANQTTAAVAMTAETTTEEQTAELDWPKKTITIICPYSAGGGSDLMSRAVADELSKRLGVSVVVEDQPGGSGSIGMSLLSAAKPDGYTLILTAAGACTLSPWTSDVGYTPENFAPICQVSESPTIVCVNASSEITTWEDLLGKAQENPGTVTYGTSGAGGAHHIAMAALGLEIAGDANLFMHTAYGGGSEAVTALLGGHIDATASIYSEPSAYVESGDFVPVLTFGDARPDYLPDTPTTKELGYDSAGGTWYAFAAPAGTEQAIVDFLEETILDIMSDPAMVETFENLGNPVVLLDQTAITEKWNNGYVAAEKTLRAIGMIE